MTGWSISLHVPSDHERAATIREYFDYAERKRAEFCSGDEDLGLDEYRRRALRRYEADGDFFISMPVDTHLAEYADFEEVLALADDWVISGEHLDDLVSLLREATAELERDDEELEWDYTCYTEASPIALCEFARENGYAVQILD